MYVCGDAATMAPDVRAAFRQIVAHFTASSEAAAEEYMERVRESKRYLEDVWG